MEAVNVTVPPEHTAAFALLVIVGVEGTIGASFMVADADGLIQPLIFFCIIE